MDKYLEETCKLFFFPDKPEDPAACRNHVLGRDRRRRILGRHCGNHGSVLWARGQRHLEEVVEGLPPELFDRWAKHRPCGLLERRSAYGMLICDVHGLPLMPYTLAESIGNISLKRKGEIAGEQSKAQKKKAKREGADPEKAAADVLRRPVALNLPSAVEIAAAWRPSRRPTQNRQPPTRQSPTRQLPRPVSCRRPASRRRADLPDPRASACPRSEMHIWLAGCEGRHQRGPRLRTPREGPARGRMGFSRRVR